MSIKSIILLISFLVIAKSLIWLLAIPVFQSPDEAMHFAYIQYLAEEGKRAHPRRGSIVSQELISAAEILNFNWGKTHPVWQDYQTDWQEKIKNINEKERRKYVAFEQRTIKNPPLYYWLAAVFYKIASGQTFLVRFYAVRFFSFLLFTVVVFFTYKIGRLLFTTQKEALTLMSLVAFQPMFSFIGVSINNDILAILIATLFIYFGLKAIKFKKKNDIFIALILILIGLLVKPILIVLLFAFPFILNKNKFKGSILILSGILLLLVLSFFLLNSSFDWLRYQIALADYQAQIIFLTNFFNKSERLSFLWQYFQENKETYLNNLFPWYWGVFGWLEATMPLWVYRILKIICLLTVIGWFKWLIIKKKINRSLIFLIATMLFFSLAIIFNDFKVFATTGEVFGIQGRYFLPIISAQMIILMMGLKILLPKRFENYLLVFLFAGSILLNFVGFLTMYHYFYE